MKVFSNSCNHGDLHSSLYLSEHGRFKEGIDKVCGDLTICLSRCKMDKMEELQ